MNKIMNTMVIIAYTKDLIAIVIIFCAICSALLPREEDGREIFEHEEDYLRIASIDNFALNSGNFEITFTGTAIIEEQILGKEMDPAQIAKSAALKIFIHFMHPTSMPSRF